MARTDRLELAKLVTTYFTEYLDQRSGLSQTSILSYRDGVGLYLKWLGDQIGCGLERLEPRHLDADGVLDFLQYLETDRKNSINTRNQRLCALRSFFGHLAHKRQEMVLDSARISLIEGKRGGARPLIDYLKHDEMLVLLGTMKGESIGMIRDRAMFTLMYAYGLRVGEVRSLSCSKIFLGSDPKLVVHGKGRKNHAFPLTQNRVVLLENWLAVRSPRNGADALFLNRDGEAFTRNGIADRLAKYVKLAERECPTIADKHVTPHVLRHSCAMRVFRDTASLTAVGDFLRHADAKSTQIYLHASIEEKEEIMFDLGAGDVERGDFSERAGSVLAALNTLGGTQPELGV